MTTRPGWYKARGLDKRAFAFSVQFKVDEEAYRFLLSKIPEYGTISEYLRCLITWAEEGEK